MIDLNAVEKVNTGYRQITKHEWVNILDTWFALKRVADAAETVESHPAFCVGTRSCDELPQGVMPRMKDLREALELLYGGPQ